MPTQSLAPGILSLKPLSYIKPTFLVSLDPVLWEATGGDPNSPERSGLDYIISVAEAKREMIDEDTYVIQAITTRNNVLEDSSLTEIPFCSSEGFFEVVQRQCGAFEKHDQQVLLLNGVKTPEDAQFLLNIWVKEIFDRRLYQNYQIS